VGTLRQWRDEPWRPWWPRQRRREKREIEPDARTRLTVDALEEEEEFGGKGGPLREVDTDSQRISPMKSLLRFTAHTDPGGERYIRK
jgi:hypothetical protein